MFPTPPATSGGRTSLMYEPTDEGDSLTQQIRALVNYLQAQGKGTFDAGQGVFGQGANTTAQANKDLQPTVDYWSAILSGDPSKMTAAVAPTATMIGKQYDAASRGAATTLPRGGYSSGLQASLPFQKASQIGNLYEQLQPMAAQGLQSAAGARAGIGGQLGQLGLGESGLGFNLFNLGANTNIARRGQNTNMDMSNLTNLTKGLQGVFSGLV